MAENDPSQDDTGTAVAPEPDDRPPRDEPEEQPDEKLAGSTGWQALAPPGKPDGEVDTRPQVPPPAP